MEKAKKTLLIIFFVALVSALSACDFFRLKTYAVLFYDGDTLVKAVSTSAPAKIAPPSLEREGYFISCWRERGGEGEFGADYDFVETNEFVAVWSAAEYSIEYDLSGGENGDNPSFYTIEDSFTLSDAFKEGCEFLGWTGAGVSTPEKGLTIEKGTAGDLYFKAEFAERDRKYLYFETFGGTPVERAAAENGVFYSACETEKAGYDFEGWYFDEALTQRAVFPVVATETITTLYAKFTPTVYRVYSVDGAFATIDFNVETPDFSIPAPEKIGFVFEGFFEQGSLNVEKEYVVKTGTAKDIYIGSRFSAITYTISFETFGGSEVEPILARYGDEISAPQPPQKAYCDFTGWYSDELCCELFVFSTMPAEDFTLYAGWYTDDIYELSYSATAEDVTISANRPSGGKVIAGETVTLSAPAYSDGAIFSCWESSGKIYTYDNELYLAMPQKDLSLVAVYSAVETVSYDLSGSGDLRVTASNSALKLDGAGLKTSDYTLSGASAYIKESFLKTLSDGYYPLLLTTSSGGAYFTLRTFYSSTALRGAKIDYDVAFPAVTLVAEGCGSAGYEYSLNGGEYRSFYRETVIEDYDKSLNNTVIVRNPADTSDFVSVTKEAYTARNKKYMEKSFDLGGRTYDAYIESDEEFFACIDYIIEVYAPINRSASDYAGGTAAYDFCFSPDYYAVVGEDIKAYFAKALNGKAPYSPDYSYSTSGYEVTLTVKFLSDALNEVASTQERAAFSDAQVLTKTSSRAEDFDDFKIERFAVTQRIRTLYELEGLPYGVRPVFDDTAGIAYEVYSLAKDVLRRYVDDDMSDFEKALAIFDYLALNVTYDHAVADDANAEDVGKYAAFTSYGVFKNKIAVCDGIAGAYALLCKIEGIECVEVSGMARASSEAGSGGAHAWNKVKLGGLWYNVDATWSQVVLDGVVYARHDFFCVDEFAFVNGGHEENGTLDDDRKYVDNVAISRLNYFNAQILSVGDYTAESTEEIKSIIVERYRAGATVVEMLIKGGNVSKAINRAEMTIHKRITYYTGSDGKYYIVIG